jgi:hypothetical protein
MLIHIYFWFFVVWKYDMIFVSLRDLVVYMKTRHFLLFFHINVFAIFQRKPGILIPDLYLYSIKIQTNIKQNWYKIHGKITNFERIFLEYLYKGMGWPKYMGWAHPGWDEIDLEEIGLRSA